jgi:transcription initiation protein SPT3
MLHLCPEVTQGRGSDGVKKITVQEINEAIRRYTMQSTKKLSSFRNNSMNQKIPYLAL